MMISFLGYRSLFLIVDLSSNTCLILQAVAFLNDFLIKILYSFLFHHYSGNSDP